MNDPSFPPELLTKSTAKRLDYFKACTIAHPRLQEADQALRAAISEPTGELLILFYGPTGVGKTTVVGRCMRRIIEERRKEMEENPGYVPVVGMEAISPERGDFNWRDLLHRCVAGIQRTANQPKNSNFGTRRWERKPCSTCHVQE